VPEQQRGDDARDPGEDQVSLAEVAALEPPRALHLADPHGDPDPDQHEHREHVHQEEEPALVAEPRDRPVTIDRPQQRHHDRRAEHEEAPEDEGVHQPGDEPLEELALPEHDDRFVPGPLGHLAGAIRRLAGADEAAQVERAPREHATGERHRGEEREGGDGSHDGQALEADACPGWSLAEARHQLNQPRLGSRCLASARLPATRAAVTSRAPAGARPRSRAAPRAGRR
jgi:hypothetical protein